MSDSDVVMSNVDSSTIAIGIAGVKRKHEEMAAAPPSDNNHDNTTPMTTPSVDSSSSSKKARLEIQAMSLSERASLDATLAAARAANPAHTGERVCIRTEIEVDELGCTLIHLSIFTPTAASRAAAKDARYQQQRAAHLAKRQSNKAKAKDQRAAIRQAREAQAKELFDAGKTKDEVVAFMRAQSAASLAASGKAPKRSNREVQETKRQLLHGMRTQQLQRVVVDCAFDHLMELEEICSLSKQIRFMYGRNMRAQRPAHLILTSLGATPTTSTETPAVSATTTGEETEGVDHFQELRQDTEARRRTAAAADEAASPPTQPPTTTPSESPNNVSTPLSSPHAVTSASASATSASPPLAPSTRTILKRMDGFERLPFDRTRRHFKECFDHSSLVYLTAESPTVLDRLDPNDVYIIGGIVDHNRMKGLCHQLATNSNIRTARLPLPEFMVNDRRTVITVNQVFEILVEFGSRADGDWGKVFKAILPARANWKERKEIAANEEADAGSNTNNQADATNQSTAGTEENDEDNDARMDAEEQEEDETME